MSVLNTEEREDCQDIFKLLDYNKNQVIESSELGKGLRGLGLNPTEAEVRKLLTEFDKDHNNTLSEEEFRGIYKRCLSSTSVTEDEIRAQFRKLDKNGDGTLDARELRNILTTGDEALTEEEVDLLIRDFDRDGDGVLSIKEFVDGILSRV
ncbi:unnamed protein product [Blepharisma stoltei]|uniref:EF-hand domain-containing protein n=1 Tax=Blepharisma stoltei TaxID=1481888 RepID=A0AAU9JMS0_9CILI|nr:unnamed protein product [Blepharisma stoltei]